MHALFYVIIRMAIASVGLQDEWLALLSLVTSAEKTLKKFKSTATPKPKLVKLRSLQLLKKPKLPAKEESFSFLKELKEIYEIPKSALEVNGRAKVVTEKKKPKRKKLRFGTSAVKKQKSKKKRKRKRKKMKKLKRKSKIKAETEGDSDERENEIQALLNENLTEMLPIRKRRVVEKKKLVFGDVDNPTTLLDNEQQEGEHEKLADGSLIESELDDEMEGSEFDPKKLQSLQLLLQMPGDKDEKKLADKPTRKPNKELKYLKDEINCKNLTFESLLRFPKLPLVQCCRFELPIDSSILVGMKPIDYLKRYCIVASKRRQLCEKIFGKFRSVDSTLAQENVFKAVSDAFGDSVVNSDQFKSVCKLADFKCLSPVELEEFIGLVALTERYLCFKGEESESRDTIEKMDFNYFNVYKRGIEIEEKLNDLLLWIKSS
ncbi:hypothetical protein CHUAL_005690 [Chamberlinius hualienensis]